MRYIHRELEKHVTRATRSFPALVLTGSATAAARRARATRWVSCAAAIPRRWRVLARRTCGSVLMC